MNNTEKIILVNSDDQITGSETKIKVHEKGLLHRAFSVFIINKDEMLLQRRNITKYHSGGLWSNACCSHQRLHESLEEAAHRRLNEELGIQCDLKELFTFIYHTKFPNGLTEYELDHVFLGHYSGDVCPNPDEIEEAKWEKIDIIRTHLDESQDKYSYWFREAFPRVMEILRYESF